jgi:hypothetical protein
VFLANDVSDIKEEDLCEVSGFHGVFGLDLEELCVECVLYCFCNFVCCVFLSVVLCFV